MRRAYQCSKHWRWRKDTSPVDHPRVCFDSNLIRHFSPTALLLQPSHKHVVGSTNPRPKRTQASGTLKFPRTQPSLLAAPAYSKQDHQDRYDDCTISILPPHLSPPTTTPKSHFPTQHFPNPATPLSRVYLMHRNLAVRNAPHLTHPPRPAHKPVTRTPPPHHIRTMYASFACNPKTDNASTLQSTLWWEITATSNVGNFSHLMLRAVLGRGKCRGMARS